MQSDSVKELAAALAKARPKIEAILKNKTAKVKGQTKAGAAYEYEYHYADLDGVLKSVVPALSEFGLSVIQPLAWRENVMLVRTILLHSSGEWIESEFPVPANAEIQKVGAAITYIRRYALSGIVGVASEDDTDAQHVGRDKPKAQKPKPAPVASTDADGHAKAYFAATKAKGMTLEESKALMWDLVGAERSADVPADQWPALMAGVEKWERQ